MYKIDTIIYANTHIIVNSRQIQIAVGLRIEHSWITHIKYKEKNMSWLCLNYSCFKSTP